MLKEGAFYVFHLDQMSFGTSLIQIESTQRMFNFSATYSAFIHTYISMQKNDFKKKMYHCVTFPPILRILIAVYMSCYYIDRYCCWVSICVFRPFNGEGGTPSLRFYPHKFKPPSSFPFLLRLRITHRM